MQKKLFTLAVAGLAAAPAFAQSNVTVYGLVDMGYRWSGKNITSGIGSRVGLDSGVMAQSRIGFKGTEDLGNGLKVSFVLERGLNSDTGTDSTGWNRQAFVALSGDLGTVAFGRQQTPQWIFASRYDPFGNTTDATMMRTYLYNARLDNLAAYVSPDWNGFSFIAGYTHNGIGDEGLDNNVLEARVAAFSPTYTSGNFSISLNVNWIKLQSMRHTPGTMLRRLDGEKVMAYDLFASYDFGPVKLAGAIGKRNSSEVDFALAAGLPEYGNAGNFSDAEDTTQYMLGVTIPVGSSGKILASYAHRKTDLVDAAFNSTGDKAKVNQYAVGYFHSLSKRTTLYTAYNYVKNNSDAKNGQSYSGAGGGRGYQRAFNVGVLHSF